MMLRRDNDLAVFRIRLDRRGRELADGRRVSAVVFELHVGSQAVVELARVSPAELGLPDEGSSSSRGDLPITLPAGLLEAAALRDALAGRSALWLELPAPSGLLRPLPWEAALHPLGVPVLRLPYFALRPSATAGRLTIAVCASSPAAKGSIDVPAAMERFVAAVRRRVGAATRVHVFTDEDWAGEVRAVLQADAGVTVHEPREAADYALPRRTTEISDNPTLQNPWLLWIREKLADAAVDHVHFYCHGYRAGDGGALALASSPLINTDRRLSRFVGAPELLAFLSTVGAWSAGFTGPDNNYSQLGLRALADAVAEGRPGPVLAHEATWDDPTFAELGDALSATIGPLPAEPPRLENAAVWIHPHRIHETTYPTEGESARGDGFLDAASHSMLFGTATAEALAASVTPTWVASSARILEQAQAKWLSSTQTGLGDVAAEGTWPEQAADALRYVSGLLEAHVRESGDRR